MPEQKVNSDNPKKEETSKQSTAGEAAEYVADQKDSKKSEYESTVPILTLEEDAVPSDANDDGVDPYNKE
jgi:hypothetical protein